MIGVDVRSNIKEVAANFRYIADGLKDKAIMRALNRTLDQTATATSREIRKVYNVKHAAVLKAMNKSKASRASLYATLEMRGKRLGLVEFDARQTGRGVSVQVKVGGGRKVISHSFLATNRRTGYEGVFVRVGRARYPIQNLRSISIPVAFKQKAVMDSVKQVTTASFKKNFSQQMKYLVKRTGGGD